MAGMGVTMKSLYPMKCSEEGQVCKKHIISKWKF
jgi:hypothetical protein